MKHHFTPALIDSHYKTYQTQVKAFKKASDYYANREHNCIFPAKLILYLCGLLYMTLPMLI